MLLAHKECKGTNLLFTNDCYLLEQNFGHCSSHPVSRQSNLNSPVLRGIIALMFHPNPAVICTM